MRRDRLNKECRSVVYEILYAQKGKTATFGQVHIQLQKYIHLFNFKTLSHMKIKDLENFKLFLKAMDRASRLDKQLPFKKR